jgi:hypothetical protein
MRGQTKLMVAALIAVVLPAGISTTTSALAPGGVSSGFVTVSPPTGAAATTITLSPPAGAACQGDSATGGYRWQSFIASASVDVGTLTYSGVTGPNAVAGAVVAPLVDVFGSLVIAKTTAVSTGLLVGIPTIDFSRYPNGTFPDGNYSIGFACTLAGATTLFWSSPIRVTNPGGVFTYAFGAVPAAPVLASPLTAGDGTLAGTFTATAAAPAITGFTVSAVPTAGSTITLQLAAGATSFTLAGLANGTSYAVSVVATNTVGTSVISNTVNGTPSAPAVPVVIPPVAVALPPARLADTRAGQHTVDGLYEGQGIRAAGSTLELTVAGRGSVDPAATAVTLNVTVANTAGSGYVTVYPCGAAQPTASNLNFTPRVVVPNAVIAKVGTNGQVCIFVSATTDLIVDVAGFFPVTTSLRSINPARVLETRVGPGLVTIDGLQQGDGPRAPGSITSVQIGGRATVPNDATAVVLNVTVTNALAPGYVTVYPCGTSVPTASNINYVAGDTVANLVVAKIGTGASVCIFNSAGVDLIADVNGYFPATTSYQPLDPARLLETRSGLSTIDGQFNGIGLRPVNTITELPVTTRGGVPAGAATVVLNVTVTESTAEGFVTVYPCGIEPPLASNLNYGVGATVANAVIVKVGTGGKVCLFSTGPTQLVVDVNGYLAT